VIIGAVEKRSNGNGGRSISGMNVERRRGDRFEAPAVQRVEALWPGKLVMVIGKVCYGSVEGSRRRKIPC
jgi:hypothetical protein